MSADVTAVLQKAKTREDALKMLEPSRKKLPSLEAQRISGVLENCISQVEIVAMLPAVLTHLDSLSNGLDKELSGALREHRLLEERLESLDGLKQGSDGGQEGEPGEARERARAQLERDIKSSFRNVLRLFRAHPDTILALRAEVDMEAGVNESMQSLVGGLKKFHGFMLERLLTSSEEEQQQSVYMEEVSSRHAHNMELMASLEAEVAAAIKHRDAEISKKDDVIKKLKTSLHHMEKMSKDFILRTQQDTDKQSQSHVKTSEMKQTRMQQEIDQLNVQLSNLILENREAETVIREKNYKVETEIENLIQKYDADMEEKQVELEEMQKTYEEEEEELRKLEEAYAVLEVEYSQIQEERRLAEERREEEKRELELKTRAAILAQAWWRGYCTRKAMKGKGKSKKGKKGKGKKGK
uniref:dynein regulatory complex protein 10 n=1 Tax=Centroberyx gerrardi TaxID=166262 RepID=UPI003AAC2B92